MLRHYILMRHNVPLGLLYLAGSTHHQREGNMKMVLLIAIACMIASCSNEKSELYDQAVEAIKERLKAPSMENPRNVNTSFRC